MTRRTTRGERRRERRAERRADNPPAMDEAAPRKGVRPFQPLTTAQDDYADAIDSSVFTFGLGPAGTGKTYVAACKACEHLLADSRNRVVLTRPAVEAAGESLGFLPGGLADKFGPYMKPLMAIFIERLGHGFVNCAVKNGRIVMLPMAFMRGETFRHSLILADEMQNATREQLKMLLTRLGEGSRMIIDGDPDQSDIGGDSGLDDAVYRLRHLHDVKIVQFTRRDIVRHSIIQHVIEAYES